MADKQKWQPIEKAPRSNRRQVWAFDGEDVHLIANHKIALELGYTHWMLADVPKPPRDDRDAG